MRSSLPRAYAGLVILLFTLASAREARAFCRETTQAPDAGCACPDTGSPLFWADKPIEYTFNEQGFPNVSPEALRAVFARSFAHWSSVSCEGEPVALSISAQAEETAMTQAYTELEPNHNVIAYLSADEFSAVMGSPDAFALTRTVQRKSTGEIVDADIVFNEGLGPFTVCPKQGCDDGSVDIENVATHEIGHFLGLAHSPVAESTMACSADSEDIQKRTLADDDIAGICSIYGPEAIAERAEALHASQADVGCGCRISGAGGAGTARALSITLLALFALRRSGRRRHR
jgi:hypothetical protein